MSDRDKVFVTVGNMDAPFTRLLSAVEAEIRDGILHDASVTVQAGKSVYLSDLWRSFPTLPPDDFRRYLLEADLVICHAGAGTLIQAITANKRVVAMPRRAQFGEHVDDHQVELAEILAEQGRIVIVGSGRDLRKAIQQARGREGRRVVTEEAPLSRAVANALRTFR